MSEELFPVVDEQGNVISKATRTECHSGSMLLHPVVHLHIFKPGGYIYLQKRAMNKDIQPGKWDTAVGGHVDYGETIADAMLREVHEELGLDNISPLPLISYIFKSNIEQELVTTCYILVDDTFAPKIDAGEISEARFWHIDEIESSLGKGILTPNFEQEYKRIKTLVPR